jgi:RNA polymerase sigma-70 factor (ECF subfamily)
MADREIDHQAKFREVYDQSLEKVTAYVRRRVPGGEIEDAVADVFLVVWRRFDDLPPGPEALLWIYGVARRVVSDRRRSLLRRERLAVRLGTLRPGPDAPNSPDRDAAVDKALLQLAPKDRELLMLTYWEELLPDEIAALMGVSLNAIAIRLHRARRRFAVALAKIELEERGKVS